MECKKPTNHTDMVHTMLMSRYKTLQEESARYGETNDCTVIATAMVLGLTYNEAHVTLYKLGRTARHGFHMERLELSQQYKHRFSKRTKLSKPEGGQYSVKSAPDLFPVGKHLIYTKNHVLAVIHGKVYDWTEDRKHRIISYTVVDDSILTSL